MSNGLENAIARTRVLAGLSKARELTDRHLLAEFAGGDETAFTALVDRYGGLVMGVCQRILQHTQDAEDAFQATFLVLAKKATKIAWQDSVANWLHGVACRIAFQVRREKARHRNTGVLIDQAAAGIEPTWGDLKPVLDEELERLPVRFRIPIILCCLEGKSRDEAATQLGWSLGSLKGRLERGREILRSRLARRGLALSAALAATLISTAGAQAAVPLALGFETVRAGMAMLTGQTAGIVSTQALTLAQGALHAMFIAKIKCAAAVVLAVLTLGIGAGYATHQALARDGSAVIAERPNLNFPAPPTPIDNRDDARQMDASVPDLADFLVREERKPAPTVVGIVKSVDAGKITVQTGRGDDADQSFDVAKDVKIIHREGRETKEGKFADVKVKDRVKLILNDAKKIVQTIEVGAPVRRPESGERPARDDSNFRGFVTSIDTTKMTITFEMGGREQAPTSKTFDLAKDVKVITRTGRTVKDSKLADVPLKSFILVTLDETKKIVRTIEVPISTTRSGNVSAVNEKSITLTNPRRNEDAVSVTYALAKDVKIQYHLPGTAGREGKGAVKELKRADLNDTTFVTVQLDDELKVVQSIDVQLPQVSGSLLDIDVKKGTLLLRPGRGDDLGLSLDKAAKIYINGKEGTLDAITNAAEAHLILTPDRTRILLIRTPPSEGREE